jgi:aminopeptidase N
LPGTNLTRAEAAHRADLLQVASYHVSLDLAAGERTFRSVSTVRFDCARPGSDTFIDLLDGTVSEVMLNGRQLPIADVVSEGRIALAGLAAANKVVVTADCPYMHTGEGLHRFVDPVDKEVYLYSQFEVADARRVFACFDQPDLKATFSFSVRAPSHWQVVSVSPTPSPTPDPASDGTARWDFEPTPLLSTYVNAIVAGPYHRVQGELTSSSGRQVPLGVFCRASLAQHLDAGNILEITRAGFGWYERTFDHPYPFAKYDQLFVPEFNAGAMENAGTVTITEQYVFRSKVTEAVVERRGLTLLHELAHMWFGDLVTMRWWDDLWLNESFAELASTRCQAEATRWTSAWTTFHISEKAWAYRQDQLASTHPIVSDIRDLEDVEVNFDGITYAKGAAVLKQLCSWVGPEAFDAGLRSYFRRHAWGNTTLADLLAELEATSGRDLEQWSRQWLRSAGVTTLRPLVEADRNGVLRSVRLAQEAPVEHPLLRSHRLAVGCYDLVEGRLRRTGQVTLDVDGAATDVPELSGRRRPDLMLANDDDLAYTKLRLDDVSLATAVDHLGGFADSLPRALVWGAAWDMTRDAELPARRFVDLVLGPPPAGGAPNLSSLGDPSVASTLLAQVGATLDFYVAPQHRHEAEAAAADRLLALLLAAEPGADHQLLLVRAFAAHAVRPAQLALARRLLDGERQLPGLAVDTDLRWSLLTALVVGGEAGPDAIEVELDRDDTAAGRVHAAAAQASVPTAEAKSAAWKSVVEDGDLPNAVQAAVIRGFGRCHDRRLLAPYVEPYFEVLARIWQERTREMAGQIVTGLYPLRQPAELVLERTDRWLAATAADPPLRRLVLEARDGVARAQRAQARDAAPGSR